MNSSQKNWVSIVGSLILAAFLVLGLGVDLFGWMYNASQAPEPAATTTATVVRTVDGDTLEVKLGTSTQAVRLIGIDTPEITWPNKENNLTEPEAECFSWTARDFLADKVGTSTVTLAGDPTQPAFDEYDRRLAYVFIDDELLNATLIREGYARELTVGEGYKYQADFRTAERVARDKGAGLWSACRE